MNKKISKQIILYSRLGKSQFKIQILWKGLMICRTYTNFEIIHWHGSITIISEGQFHVTRITFGFIINCKKLLCDFHADDYT